MTVIKTVLFDLDGTLVDTAPDMAAALDLLCDEVDHPVLPFEKVRPVVSDGSVAPVSYTHLTLPTIQHWCRSRWSPWQ